MLEMDPDIHAKIKVHNVLLLIFFFQIPKSAFTGCFAEKFHIVSQKILSFCLIINMVTLKVVIPK